MLRALLRPHSWLPLFGALAAAAGAGAEELRLGAQVTYTYDSNFFTAGNDEEDANSFEIGPIVQLADPDGRFTHQIDYTGTYQAYVDQDDVDAWENRLTALFTYELDSLTRIRVRNRFRDISNLRFNREDVALTDTAFDPTQDQYFRNDLELELIRELNRYFELRVGGGYQWVDFDRNVDRNDSEAWIASSELRYRIARQHQVGVGVEYIFQDFDEADSRLGSRADSVNAFLSWNWQLSDRLSFFARGGPAWIRSDEDDSRSVRATRFVGGRIDGDVFRADFNSCNTPPVASDCDFNTAGAPPIPASDLGGRESFALGTGERVGTDNSITFFAAAALEANYDEWNLTLQYSRRQSTTSGDALASSLDRVFLEVEYAPRSTRWSVFMSGAWDRRETLTEATVIDYTVIADPVDGSAQRDVAFTDVENNRGRRNNLTAIVGLRWAFARYVSGSVDFRFRRSEIRDTGATRDGIDSFFVVFALRYDHDVIRF